MVVMYQIMGRQVGAHILAMATLGTAGAIGFASMGGKTKAKKAGPPIDATSKEEEAFIQEFLRNADVEEQKAKH